MILFGFLQARKQYLSRNRPDLKGLEEAWIIEVEKHNKIMKRLSKKYNVAFIRPDQSLFNDAWFFDNCHFNEQGEAVKAAICINTCWNTKTIISRTTKNEKMY